MRNTVKLLLFFALYLWGIILPAFAGDINPILQIDDIEVLFLKNRSLGLDELVELHSADFRPAERGIVRFWNFRDSLWIRIPMPRLKNLLEDTPLQESTLVIRSEYVSHADFYLPLVSGDFRHFVHGMDTPVEKRSFPSRFPAFSLRGAAAEGFAYLNVTANLPISIKIVLIGENTFYSIFVARLTKYMAFYSFLGALMLTYFFFYLMTGDKRYSSAALMQMGTVAFVLALNGYLQYSFNIAPRTVYIASWLGLGVHCVAASCLCGRFFRKEPRLGWSGWLLRVQTLMGVALLITAFSKMPFLTLSVAFIAFITEALSVSLMAAKIMRYRHNLRQMFLFAASRSAFLVGLVFLFMDMLFVSREAYLWGFMVGFMLDPVFLTLMLIPDTRNRLEDYFNLEKRSARYESLSQRDSMTGLYNKTNLLSLLDDHVRVAQKNATPLAFMMLDIDHFKHFNDTWGHVEGDRALVLVSQIIRQSLRESDLAARYGGEEFSVILPGGTLPVSVLVAERIRKTCETQSKTLGEGKGFTLSLGLAFLHPEDDGVSLLRRADESLYRAKENGRNRTEFEVLP